MTASRMLGRSKKPLACRYGCCHSYADNGKRANVRSAKRRERRTWQREVAR